MASIIRVTINLTGFTGGPGYTNLHFKPVAGGDIAQAHVNDARDITQTWLTSWRYVFPASVFSMLSPTVTELEEDTGHIKAFWTTTVAAGSGGFGTGNYAGGSGACVNWYTDGVVNGRRVRGRTFMVPAAGSALAADGTLDNTLLATWRTANNTLAGAANLVQLVVWKRPTKLAGVPLANGQAFDVNATTLNDKAAQLKSRRD
jgi:hypothetical protein